MKISRRLFGAAVLACALPTLAHASLPAGLSREIAGARQETMRIGEGLWPGYGKAPFGMLVVQAGGETLVCHPGAATGFTSAGEDAATGCTVQTRAAIFPTNLLAAMPVIDNTSTIVMGTPETTGRAVPDWTRTIFHEHFHQYQSILPDYYERVAKLDLKNGDQTGMWMLNYPFPYADGAVGALFAETGRLLAMAIAADEASVRARYADFLQARRKLAAGVAERDWRYFEFQLWQEGAARWTEIAIGLQSGDAEVRKATQALRARTLSAVAALDLKKDGRLAVYPYGAAEAMLLDRCSRDWRLRYPAVFSLGVLFDAVQADACR